MVIVNWDYLCGFKKVILVNVDDVYLKNEINV